MPVATAYTVSIIYIHTHQLSPSGAVWRRSLYPDWRLQYQSPSEQSAAQIHSGFVREACRKIVGIAPHIHRVTMSVEKAPMNLLRARLPKFNQLDSDGRRAAYWYMAYFYLQGVKFKIYYWTESRKADAMVEVVSPSPASLVDLSQRLRALNMSSVEYAIDFKCGTASDVPMVHWLLRRYAHFPGYTGPVNAGGRVFRGIDDDGDENSVSYFWNQSKGNPNAVKIYERGPDGLGCEKENGKPFWIMDELDRVRLEFVLTNEKLAKKRKDLGVKSLSGFRHCPRMADVLGGQFSFSAFTKSNKLPREWGRYAEFDASGGIESFHVEWLAARRKVSNIQQCYRASRLMTPLMRKVQNELALYDEKWAAQAKETLELIGSPEGRIKAWTVI